MTPQRTRLKIKESGIEWVGGIPKHWRVLPFYSFADEVIKPNNSLRERNLLSLSYGRIVRKDIERLEGLIPTSFEGYNIIEANDIVFRLTDLQNDQTSLRSARATERGIITSAYVTVRPRSSPRFFDYLMRSYDTAKVFYGIGGGIRQSMKFSDLKRLPVVVPPDSEMEEIVSYLDRATTRIDALVAKKARFIELLRERRQALITRAATKGLDISVPMKDSGVDWLGEVPSHWGVSRLAYVVSEQGGKTPTTTVDAYWNGDIPWVTPKDMKVSDIFGSIDTISEAAISGYGMTLIAPGAILVVVRGMILAHSFPVAELKVPATINQDMKALVPIKKLLPDFLRVLLESYKEYVVAVAVAEAAHGTRVLRTEVWRLLPALLPPIGEQKAIVAHLSRATARIDALIAKTERSIELLREHRTALITAAVTGKIDLREAS